MMLTRRRINAIRLSLRCQLILMALLVDPTPARAFGEGFALNYRLTSCQCYRGDFEEFFKAGALFRETAKKTRRKPSIPGHASTIQPNILIC
jgi:hypothetical protein